jgi:hypothetical protein
MEEKAEPRKFGKARCSQRLKYMPTLTKCTFWVNFVGKTLRSDKKVI